MKTAEYKPTSDQPITWEPSDLERRILLYALEIGEDHDLTGPGLLSHLDTDNDTLNAACRELEVREYITIERVMGSDAVIFIAITNLGRRFAIALRDQPSQRRAETVGSARRITRDIFIGVVCLVLGSLMTARFYSPKLSPTDPLDRAYQECRPCGLSGTEVDSLIDTMQHSTLSRDGNLGLFYDTFPTREDAAVCLPCAEAVLDAAMENDG